VTGGILCSDQSDVYLLLTSPISPAWNWRRALSCQRMLAFLSYTAHSRASVYFTTVRHFSPKIAPSHGGSRTHLTIASRA